MRKVLVANRGEIAVRALRAAVELGLRTVAVHTHADRDALHRFKADEAYQIGPAERPLAGYLDAGTLVDAAVSAGADALYPGYGFLSESPELARRCEQAGITFVGPPPAVLELTGDKVRAREHAQAAGVPTLAASPALDGDEETALHAAGRIGYPVFVKAAAGGGGRGLRLVTHERDLSEAIATARREALGAFGDATVFLEKAVRRPRHIEVQVLADTMGGIVHLFERDCSIQRRHQKLLEIAPAPQLDPTLRAQLTSDALRFAREVGYHNVGTVEFLVDTATGEHVFIEMNPRIQVEHTVTEEVTDVDLVQAQLRVAAGESLDDLGLTQERIHVHGTAVQCRITTETPADGFRPDTGTITTYRIATGAGIRLDAAAEFVGAEVSPYFDPLLVKLTARGPDLRAATRRASRALREFRIRGVDTNIGFLLAVLEDPDLAVGAIDTSFVDDRPHLTRADVGQDRTSRLLSYLGDVTVHRPHGERPGGPAPVTKLPPLPTDAPPRGTRDRLLAEGPDAFARWLREREPVAVTDTTLRDAHQSLLATRVRTTDLLTLAPHLSHALGDALSLEVWGGATFDAALRFLHEDPWDRLERLRSAVPNICLQMLLRGANAVGYRNYPPTVVSAFVTEAAQAGVDIFRIFDAQNDPSRMVGAIRAVREVGRLAEGTLCYTGDLADPAERRYPLDHYLGVAEQLDAAGAHVLCIKDMAGVLRPPAAQRLVSALRERFPQPVHLHTHDTAGGQAATYLAAIEAGVDAVDVAAAPLAGSTSQPSLSAVVAALEQHPRATGLDLQAVTALEPFVDALRSLYAPFDAGRRAPTGDVYRHQIPGGQLTNLRQQAHGLGIGDRFEEVADAYVAADEMLGHLIKVTPTSKVVGDLALFLLATGRTPDEIVADPRGADLPASVLGFLRGELGVPPQGWPQPLRDRAVGSGAEVTPDAIAPEDERALDDPDRRRSTLTRLLLPGASRSYTQTTDEHGEVWRLPTELFLYGLTQGEEAVVELEPGKRLLVELEAVTDPDDRGLRTLWCRVNGQPRPIEVRDRRVEAARPAREQADPADPAHLGAPLTGVVTVSVEAGQVVRAGQPVATIEAMKMETSLTAPRDGEVARVVAPSGVQLEPGDLILELR